MNKWRYALGALLACAIALAACKGGGGGSSPVPGTGSNTRSSSGSAGYTPYTGPATLANFEWGHGLLAQATYVGPATSDTGMVMHIMPTLQNEAGLINYSQAVNNPKSASFRKFITPGEIGSEYGASNATIAKIATYFSQYGITTGTWPQKLMINAKGTMSQFAKAFGTTFAWYQVQATGRQCGSATTTCTVQFLGPTVQPHTSTVVPMTAVLGMLKISFLSRGFVMSSAGICNECNGFGYNETQVAQAFTEYNTQVNGITANGSGVTTGIVATGPACEASGYMTCASLDGITTDMGALQEYANGQPTTYATIVAMPVLDQNADSLASSGGTYDPLGGENLSTPPTPTATKSCTTSLTEPNDYSCNPEDEEAQLDTETEASLAPGSTLDFYLAYERTCYDSKSGGFTTPSPLPTGTTCPSGYDVYDLEGIDIPDDEIQQAIADNQVDTLALSYGEGEDAACYVGYLGTSGGTATDPTCADPTSGVGPAEFAALAAEGIATFVSTGDYANDMCENGSSGDLESGYCVAYPATDPSVVASGGVNIGISEAGQIIDQITDWGAESGGGSTKTDGDQSGTGGGASLYFSASSDEYQDSTVDAGEIPCYIGSNTESGVSACPYANRIAPDVDMIGDDNTGVLVTFNAEETDTGALETIGEYAGGAFGGTSVSSQELAAEWADVLSFCKQVSSCATASGAHAWRLGNPNAFYYALVADASTPPSGGGAWGYDDAIYNVQYGSNTYESETTCCYAGPGYNPANGLGVPFLGNLIKAVMHVAGVSGY